MFRNKLVALNTVWNPTSVLQALTHVWITLYLTLRNDAHFPLRIHSNLVTMLRFDAVVLVGDIAGQRNVQSLCIRTRTLVSPEDCTGLETGSHVCLWKSRGASGWGLSATSQLFCCTCCLDTSYRDLCLCWSWEREFFVSHLNVTQASR